MSKESNSSEPNQAPATDRENSNGASATLLEDSSDVKSVPNIVSGEAQHSESPTLIDTQKAAQQQPGPDKRSPSLVTLGAVALMILGLAIDNVWLGYVSAIAAMATSIRMMWPSFCPVLTNLIPPV